MKPTYQKHLAMLDVVATALGPLAQQVVFVGGAVVGLLLDDPGSALIRATLDVDLVVEAISNADYYKFGKQLKKRGFTEDTRERAPLCRWRVAGTTVDIMPSDPRPLGFTNPWYALALKTSVLARLPSGISINLIGASAFLGTKLTALSNRGMGDLQASHDMEDIVTLLDGRLPLESDIATTDSSLRSYIVGQLRAMCARSDVEEILVGHLGSDVASQGRLPILLSRIRRIVG